MIERRISVFMLKSPYISQLDRSFDGAQGLPGFHPSFTIEMAKKTMILVRVVINIIGNNSEIQLPDYFIMLRDTDRKAVIIPAITCL